MSNYGVGTCVVCKKSMTLWRKDQLRHKQCYPVFRPTHSGRSTLSSILGRTAIKSLGVTIPKGWCVHHIDGDWLTNIPKNLLVLSNATHTQLHAYLRLQWLQFMKENDSASEEQWNILGEQLTVSWLKTTNTDVIKICAPMMELADIQVLKTCVHMDV